MVGPIREGYQLGPNGEEVAVEEAGPLWARFRATGRMTASGGGRALAIDNDPPIVVDEPPPEDGAA